MQPHHPLRKGNEPVRGLSTELFRPSIKLVRFVAMSPIVDEDLLGERVLTRARQLGADAVILGKVDIREFMGSSPLYESTFSLAGAWYNAYSRGP